MSRPTRDAVAEFELLPRAYADGTSKLYGRGDFLPLDDMRGISESDFIGRLRALFGAVDGDEYVLRHRETGFIVTAYAAQSGPSYGGGPRHPGALPPPEATLSLPDMLAQQEAAAARVQADPILSKGRPVDWSKHDIPSLTPDEIQRMRETERAWMRRMNDVSAPPGFAEVVARLDTLISRVKPADWEAFRYWSDPPSVYRVGIEDGEPIDEELGFKKGMAWVLAEAEAAPSAAEDPIGVALRTEARVLDYWLHHADKKRKASRDALPRVQATWFRVVKRAKRLDGPLGAHHLEEARAQIEPLELDPQRAEAALTQPLDGSEPECR